MSSDPHPTPGPGGVSVTPPVRPGRHPLLTALMVLIGIVALLPGVCAVVFAAGMGIQDGSLVLLWLVCLLISGGSIALLVRLVAAMAPT